jgi:hypothetical protein
VLLTTDPDTFFVEHVFDMGEQSFVKCLVVVSSLDGDGESIDGLSGVGVDYQFLISPDDVTYTFAVSMSHSVSDPASGWPFPGDGRVLVFPTWRYVKARIEVLDSVEYTLYAGANHPVAAVDVTVSALLTGSGPSNESLVERLDTLERRFATAVSSVVPGDVEIDRGDSYLDEDGRALSWRQGDQDWSALGIAAGDVELRIGRAPVATVASMPVVDTGEVKVEMTALGTVALARGVYPYKLVLMQVDLDVATLASGRLIGR